jgi:hypothetical protein
MKNRSYKLVIPEFPEIEIGEKTFKVNNLKSNYEAMSEAVTKVKNKADVDRLMIKYLLGDEAVEYITTLDLPMPSYARLIVLLNAAVLDLSEEEADKRFRGFITSL